MINIYIFADLNEIKYNKIYVDCFYYGFYAD